MSGENLDRLCAQYGYRLAEEVCKTSGNGAENLITKSLGVLQEDGIYALFLFWISRGRSESKGAQQAKELAAEMLKELPLKPFDTIDDPLEAVRGKGKTKGLADNLDDYLLAKSLLQQALIYARYHAKAFEGENPVTARQAQES